MRLLLASESAVEKNCQGSSAANTRIGPGRVDFSPATWRNAVKMNMISSGRSNAQATPTAVCL